jgi:pimeloyl-ACP methyl ester carboxylesterase
MAASAIAAIGVIKFPALVRSDYRVVLVDSRGHGHSTRDSRPFRYELMASDVLAVMDALYLEKAAVVGWSDGACTALILGRQTPARVAGVFFFGCNMDPSGLQELKPSAPLERCFARHTQDYVQLSATLDQFKMLTEAVSLMQKTEPNYTARDLAEISVPVTVAHSEHDEFIKREHAEYLVQSIRNTRDTVRARKRDAAAQKRAAPSRDLSYSTVCSAKTLSRHK